MHRTWVLSSLCYIEKDAHYLMMNRNKRKDDIHHGKWNGLGGKLTAGESPLEGIKREVLEESGLQIDAPTLKGIMTFPKFKNNEDWMDISKL